MKRFGWILFAFAIFTLGESDFVNNVAGDDLELEQFDADVPDFDAEDRSEVGHDWKLWVSPSRLTGMKVSSVTTSMDRYKAMLADRQRLRLTAGMDEDTIAKLEPVNCQQNAGPYRTIDGSCNNIYNGCWGRAGESYSRLINPMYGDGVESPRKGVSTVKLPNVRLLSRLMQGHQIQSSKTASKYFTDLTTHFGQFLAHEISSAAPYADKAIRNGAVVQVTPVCCNTPNRDAECNHIEVPDGDSFYGHNHCIELVRSQFYNESETSCGKNNAVSKDIREQLNAVTAFIDGSLIYGSTKSVAKKLIDVDGSLKIDANSKYIKGGLMPRNTEDTTCHAFFPGCDQACFLSGDKRSSLTPILGSLQTLFFRQHNRIAAYFIAKGWDAKRVYDVTRKIIGAQIQIVVYKEYLPLMLGKEAMEAHHLTIPTAGGYRYRSSINPSTINTWAAAACRVSHSNIADKLKRETKSLSKCPSLAYDFNNMDDFCKPEVDPVRNFIVGACQQNMQELNTVFSHSITRFLFASPPSKPGKDLRAIDYIRARDHGVPPYNEWRKHCGLKPHASFEDMKKSCSKQYAHLIDKLKLAYNGKIDDMDFGVGAILEPLAPGSTFGPTVTRLFGEQFYRLKFGDRFWFENAKIPTAFSRDQLSRLYQTTLAGIICANTDVGRIQRNVFLVVSTSNPMVSCDQLLKEQDLNLASYNF